MVYYILAVLSLISFAGLFFILFKQVRYNRDSNIDYRSLGHIRVSSLAVDYFAFKIVHFFREILLKAYLFLVHFIKNCITTARYVIVKAERRFNRIAANMPEPDEVHKNDKVSFFLKEIKEHKENVMAEIHNGAIAEEIENR